MVMKQGTQIRISGKVSTLMKFANTLCYFFGFKYEEPLPEEFRLFSKGEKDKKHSFMVFLTKLKDLRKVTIKVGYETSKGSPETSTFVMDDLIPANIYNELQICFTIAQDFISGSMAYLNGKAQFFDVVNHLGYNFDEDKDRNVILDKEAKFDGKVILSIFNIIEGGGGLLNSQEKDPELVKNCKA